MSLIVVRFQVRKYKLAQAIEAAARSGRSARPKKRKKGDEDVGSLRVFSRFYILHLTFHIRYLMLLQMKKSIA